MQLDHSVSMPFLRACPGDKPPPPQKSPRTASAKSGGGVPSSSAVSFRASFVAVVNGETGPAENPKEEKDTQEKKAESLEKLLATLAADNPLRENLESQLEQRVAFKDPRNPGARLDSATAKMKKVEAKVARCEERLRQAEETLKRPAPS